MAIELNPGTEEYTMSTEAVIPEHREDHTIVDINSWNVTVDESIILNLVDEDDISFTVKIDAKSAKDLAKALRSAAALIKLNNKVY